MKKLITLILSVSVFATTLTGCSMAKIKEPDDNYRVYYEIFVRSFADGNTDGIGDFAGAAQKISYIKELGATAVWLMPIMPSDTYHKYDVNDYMAIDPEYGTPDDFSNFVNTCHQNGIKVVIDMVLNHTSDTHPWFTKACDYLRSLPSGSEPSAEECPYYEYYNFSKEKESGTFYPVSGTDYFYEGSFWEEMPDLNLECKPLREEIYEIFDFWMELGVDGFRMDAVAHYEENNDDFNIRTLGEMYDYCKSKNPDFYMVNEVWSSTDAIAKYYASGSPSNFNFDLAGPEGKIIKAARGNLKAGVFAKSMVTYEEEFSKNNQEYIDASFITNHDMGRVSNALMNDIPSVKFAGGLNLIMRGSPFIYYGEEIGMKSKGNIDENKRLAMPWIGGTSVEEYSCMCKSPEDADPDIVQENGTVAMQEDDENSILNYYKNAIKIRRSNPAIARGKTDILAEYNDGNVVVIKRTYEDDYNLIAINTGDATEVDLSDIDGPGYGISLDKLKICGKMLVNPEDTATYKNHLLSIPAKGIVVLK